MPENAWVLVSVGETLPTLVVKREAGQRRCHPPHLDRPGLTMAYRRRPTASAALPLPGAADARRSVPEAL